MREINIGRVLMQNRHKKGITQDELAEYIGVSKAAVSKWETASTYPDISLLPRLAAFFDISIDELMGYEPQMEKDDIRKLYKKLTRDFAEKPFDETMECCREIAKKYFSCPPLLFQIGALFVNHCTLSGTPEKTNAVLEEARRLFGRVREISDDAELSSLAVSMNALCLLQLGRAKEVLALLEPLERNRLSPDPLLASAFQMMGNARAAKRILQAGIYHSMLEVQNLLSSYMNCCLDDPEAYKETFRRLQLVSETFDLKTLHPGLLMSLQLSAASGFSLLNNQQQALEILEDYTELVLSCQSPLTLHGDSYFTLLDEWLDSCLPLGSGLPRDESLIRRSMTQAVIGNPAFESLGKEPRFQNIIRRLEGFRQDNDAK